MYQHYGTKKPTPNIFFKCLSTMGQRSICKSLVLYSNNILHFWQISFIIRSSKVIVLSVKFGFSSILFFCYIELKVITREIWASSSEDWTCEYVPIGVIICTGSKMSNILTIKRIENILSCVSGVTVTVYSHSTLVSQFLSIPMLSVDCCLLFSVVKQTKNAIFP